MHAHRPAARVTALLLVAATGFVDLAVAQNSEATARAFLAKYAGSDDTDALLREPAVKSELQKLVGPQLSHLTRNLDVKGSVDVISGVLAVAGNAPHGGTEEEGVVCVAPPGTLVEAAIYSKGVITVYARAEQYEFLMLCTKDWVTQVNSHHNDRFTQPKNVKLVRPR